MSEEAALANADRVEIARLRQELAQHNQNVQVLREDYERIRAERDAAEKLVSDMRETFVRMRADVWARLWKRYAKQQRAGWWHAFEAQQRSSARWRESRARVVAQRDELSKQLAVVEAERAQFRAALELASPVVCSMLCPTVWKTSEGPRPHSETCQTITALLEGGTTLTEDEVRESLRVAIEAAGGQRNFAKTYGFTPAYVNDVVHGRRAFADRILQAIGIERVTTYQVSYREKPEQE